MKWKKPKKKLSPWCVQMCHCFPLMAVWDVIKYNLKIHFSLHSMRCDVFAALSMEKLLLSVAPKKIFIFVTFKKKFHISVSDGKKNFQSFSFNFRLKHILLYLIAIHPSTYAHFSRKFFLYIFHCRSDGKFDFVSRCFPSGTCHFLT